MRVIYISGGRSASNENDIAAVVVSANVCARPSAPATVVAFLELLDRRYSTDPQITQDISASKIPKFPLNR